MTAKKNILLFFIVIIFIVQTVSAEKLINDNSNYKSLKFGVLFGYIYGYNNSDRNDKTNNSILDYYKNTLHEKYSDGLFIGLSIIYDFLEGERFSHNLLFRTQYTYIPESFLYQEYGSMISDGNIIDFTWEQDRTFNLTYLSFQLFYDFKFANKHIGFLFGPAFTCLVKNNYKLSEERVNFPPQVIIRGEPFSGKFDNIVNYSIYLCIGLEAIIKIEDLEFIPHIIYNPIDILDRNHWTMQNMNFGVDLRF